MIIKTPKFTINYTLLKKNGLKLFESNTINNSNSYLGEKITMSCNLSKEGGSISSDKKGNNKNILNTFSYISKSKTSSKYFPNINEFKKRLFLKNIISPDKRFILEDYMKHKEIDLIKNPNIKTIYDARKTFFSEKKINDNRTSYFYKEELFDKKNKYPLMIKDIQSNYILLKNKRNKKYKDYFLLKKLEEEKNIFRDINEKLGIKNIYIKSDKIFNKNKNNNLNFMSCINFFKKGFSPLHKISFNLKRKKTTI